MRLFKNILRIFRNNPMLLFVNVPGLIIGFTAFILLMLYVKHELSYDEHFKNKNRVVRLYNTLIEENSTENLPICLREAYTQIPQEVPGIEAAVQLYRGWDGNVTFMEKKLNNLNFFYADPEFFKVFGIKLLLGNTDEALKAKNRVALSQSIANKLFPENQVLGKVVKIDDANFTVTAIYKDFPKTTHFKADFITSMATINPDDFSSIEFFTYYLLKPQTNLVETANKISQINSKIIFNKFKDYEWNHKVKSGVEKLTDLHLYTKADFDLSPKGNPVYIYIVGFISLFILLIALINHINLFVLHGEKRFTEIGIRKSLGAGRISIVKMFYFETAVLTLLAFVVTFLLVPAITPYFSHLMNNNFSFYEILNPYSLLEIILFIILLILISGAYPAIYLSKLKVISAVKGDVQTLRRKNRLSVASVLIQFAISLFLIFSLLVVYAQVQFLKGIPLGFSTENLIVVNRFNSSIGKNATSIIQELQKLPFITSACGSTHSMGGGYSGQIIAEYGKPSQNMKSINEYRVQPGFGKTMKLQLIAGRFFQNRVPDRQSIILNEAAVKMLNLDNPVGKKLVMFEDPLTVIGVVKDFYYSDNSGKTIRPLVLTDYSNRIWNIYMRTSHHLSKPEIEQINKIFTSFDAEYKFDFSYVGDIYNSKFSDEDRLINLLLSGTLLAIFLGFIGMFALSVFNVERRTKEIGVRKVLGSTSTEIVIMLLQKMLKWVLVSAVPTLIIAYILMKNWLTEFTNRIDIGIIFFLIAAGLTLIVSIVAISIKSIIAARKNPVESLRYE